MIKLFIQTGFMLLIIPFLSFAIDPQNPESYCDRILNENSKNLCIEKTKLEGLDWYAASICNQQMDDNSMLSCFEDIRNKTYNPQALEICAHFTETEDHEISSCIKTLENKSLNSGDFKSCGKKSSISEATLCLKNTITASDISSPRLPTSTNLKTNKKKSTNGSGIFQSY